MKLFTYADFDRFLLDRAKQLPVPQNAVTVSAVVTPSGQPITPATNLVTCTIAATADADVASGNIAHGLSFTPSFVIITPILPQGGLKAWAWTPASTDGTNIVFTGNNVAGSGVAGAQVRVWFGRLATQIQ